MEIYKECFYGCGREGKFFFKISKRWCCENSHNRCPSNKEKNASAHRGVKRNPELMRQIGLKQRGKVFSDEHKQKLSKIWKGRKHKKETKQKMSQAQMGRRWSDEQKLNLSKCRKGKLSGEDNPNWQGGISTLPYCFEFRNDLKEYIKYRDGYKCQNETCNKKSKRLCVHHIDYDKMHCVEENLITLCNSCNSKANFNRNYWIIYYNNLMEGKEHEM